MLDLSIELSSTEKSYTFPFKDTSQESLEPTLLDMLPAQNRVGKLTFPLLPLKLKTNFPSTNK